jgi:hypothetical protein
MDFSGALCISTGLAGPGRSAMLRPRPILEHERMDIEIEYCGI